MPKLGILLTLMGISTMVALILNSCQQSLLPYPRSSLLNTSSCTSCTTIAQKCNSTHLHLLIVVFSAVSNFEQRQAVRDTWGSWKYINGTVATYFILGRSPNNTDNRLAQEEQELNRDLLMTDVLDVYSNLTYKAIAMLKTVSESCPSASYVLKADDDSFVNVPNLLNESDRFNLTKDLIFGLAMPNGKPSRDSRNKWYVPESMYPGNLYPDFVAGSAYVMSGDVPAKLYAAIPNTTYLHLEDVYITGILAEKANVTRLGSKGFFNFQRPSTSCEYRDVISGHYVSPKKMRTIWSDLSTKC